MGRPLVTACVFCLVCCAHVNCVSHNGNHDNQLELSEKPPSSRSEFINKVFQTYGNGETISPQGFEKLLRELKLDNLIPHSNNPHNETATSNSTTARPPHDIEDHSCISLETLFDGETELTVTKYQEVCPVLLSQLMPITFQFPACHHHHHLHTTKQNLPDEAFKIWLYSTVSIVIISLCGLLGVAVIPVMQQVFYHQMIQFLVALAVGTLCGDALLHLLPHAMTGSHSHDSGSSQHEHDVNIWKGLTAMLGVVFFYFTEKFLTMIVECRKKKQRKTQQDVVSKVPRLPSLYKRISESEVGSSGNPSPRTPESEPNPTKSVATFHPDPCNRGASDYERISESFTGSDNNVDMIKQDNNPTSSSQESTKSVATFHPDPCNRGASDYERISESFTGSDNNIDMIKQDNNPTPSSQESTLMPKVRVMRDAESPTSGTKVGEKLCKHKYSSYPYCYGEIANNPDNHQKVEDANDTVVVKHLTSSNANDADTQLFDKSSNHQTNGPILTKENELSELTEKSLIEANDSTTDDRYTVIIREHENAHHGHSHSHGHVHSAPQSMSSVAWMVIMGDGLHNFTDGMAIGAAFSANIAGGFSTALAVFCHELPHELGDFAVLLKAGMSAKQAVFYNLLSSVLCFFGMCAGIVLGHDEDMSQWVFSAAAGMFLYIALVDMIPELTSSHSKEGSLCQCFLHFAGLMCGILIMLTIAVYEHDLKTLFDQ